MEEFHSYKIKPVSTLGSGAFGYVEKIELYNSGNKLCGLYARKVLNPQPEILHSITLEEIKKRFIREVIYQSKCSHGNIIYIYLFNKYAENPYYIMELGESDLDGEINKNVLSEREKINIIIMLLNATKKIHDEGYLHRDIKPKNVLKFPNNVYKLSDFGLVKNIDENNQTTALTALGSIMGTRKYMAPEIHIEAEYSRQTDIYALGIVFKDLNIECAKLREVIDKCTRRDKDQRYCIIDDVLNDVYQNINS